MDAQNERSQDFGLQIGIFNTGPHNAIIDVPNVSVGHVTKIQGDNIRTGVTAIIPHQNNIYQNKLPAAIYIGNGFGKLSGYTQVKELGNIETPIILTNTLSVPTAMDALITYTLDQPGNENVRSVNAVVGETNDGFLNDIRGRHISEEDVLTALKNAASDNIEEGNVGAGTGTTSFSFKGGIGTASRQIPSSLGGYLVGVLVQTNFGGVLEMNGIPIAKELKSYPFQNAIEQDIDGSCMIVIITNAPVNERNLERMAKRGMMGLAKTGGIASNGSGDFVIAVSNFEGNLITHSSSSKLDSTTYLRNDEMSALFLATIEATEEAILNSLFAAETLIGSGKTVPAIPKKEIREIIKKYKAR